MAINFPSTSGQATDGSFTHTENGVTWSWDGTTWKATGIGAAETDPIYSASAAANVTSTKITEWDTAYGWGNHAAAGYSTLGSQATNVVIGDATTGDAITTAADNVVIGSNAGTELTTKTNNVFVGHNAGAADIGSYNVAVGPDAGDTSWGEFENVENVAVGRLAGDLRNGNGNTALGFATLSSTATSAFSFGNIALGYYAMGNYRVDGASYNTSIGQQTGYNLSSGDANLFIGDYAGYGITTGSNNVLIGTSAGDDITTGANNVIINGGNYQNGATSGFTTTTSNSLWIGHSSYAWITGASSGNTRTVTIPGQLTAGGLTYPTSNGTSGDVLTSDGAGNVSWQAGGGGVGLQSRTTAQGTTASVADGVATYLTITAAPTYALHKIQTDGAAWVTIYTDTTSRTNDASRSEATDPVPGSGVIAEVITAGAETQIISPGTVGWSEAGGDVTSDVYLKVVNKTGSTQAITVTLYYVPLEA